MSKRKRKVKKKIRAHTRGIVKMVQIDGIISEIKDGEEYLTIHFHPDVVQGKISDVARELDLVKQREKPEDRALYATLKIIVSDEIVVKPRAR